MPILARAKPRVARTIASNALAADAKQTELYMRLLAILLGGLVLMQPNEALLQVALPTA
jgi:divalent metal cation (Fe/Co/Zn/Cd) transporter